MARNHRMTPARRAALRKAQLASAARRRRRGLTRAVRSNRKVRRIAKKAVTGAVVVGGVAVGYAVHSQKKSMRIKAQTKAVNKAVKQNRKNMKDGEAMVKKYNSLMKIHNKKKKHVKNAKRNAMWN